MTDKVNIMTDSGADVAQVSLAVANRIRNWRKEKKLSLDELSRRASVSKGMLVEIEKGAANPSIAILCKLAAALGISVADIVNVSSEPLVHVIEEPRFRFCGRAHRVDAPDCWREPQART
jgi:transcriptional regulator with XRE-family HTH domain